MIKLISFKICPCYQRIAALLLAIDIPFESKFIDLEDIPEWFSDISPDIEPVIETEDKKYIAGVDNIVTYIQKAYPTAITRLKYTYSKQVKEWSNIANKLYVDQCITQRSANKKLLKENQDKLDKTLKLIESNLNTNKYHECTCLSLIDIAWLPVLHRIHLIKELTGYNFISKYPNIQLWQNKILKEKITFNSVPDNFKDVFVDFYLNENTFLGQVFICANK